jgi:hypothetical protein
VADIFISYSRKDSAFVRKLEEALTEGKRDAWVDWQDIPPTAEWLKEIDSAIDAAQAVVFVISVDPSPRRSATRNSSTRSNTTSGSSLRIDARGALHHIIARGIQKGRIFPDDSEKGGKSLFLAGLIERAGFGTKTPGADSIFHGARSLHHPTFHTRQPFFGLFKSRRREESLKFLL